MQEGFGKLDMTTVDGFKIAAEAELTATKIIRHVSRKKSDGKLTAKKTSPPKSPPGTPETTGKYIKLVIYIRYIIFIY